MLRDFKRRDVQLIGLSCDSVDQHKAWTKDLRTKINRDLDFPLIADETREIAQMLGMLDPLEICEIDKISMPARALFLIGPEKRNYLTILYPATTGRNFHEVLRAIDSLHLTNALEVGTPADWHPNGKVMPAVNVGDKFGAPEEQMVQSGRRYMRYVPQPVVHTPQRLRPYEDVRPSERDFKIKLGAKFPDFDWSATKQGINRFHQLLERLKGDLTLMICWPRNFDPIATSELLKCLKHLPELRQRRVSLIGMTCDPVENLQQWVKDAIELTGSSDEETGFTIIADSWLGKGKIRDIWEHIAVELGFLPEANRDADKHLSLARGLFVLRVLDSLILTKDGICCKGLILDPKVSRTDANKFTNLHTQAVPSKKEYLRWVDCPRLPWFKEEAWWCSGVLCGPTQSNTAVQVPTFTAPEALLDGQEWEPLPPVSKAQNEIRGRDPPEDKSYVQDMSTNGTRLNGKRLPRPPYKHPMDARVRIFHGDELVLAITPDGEELGFVVNLLELSG
eukprot:g23399.t1